MRACRLFGCRTAAIGLLPVPKASLPASTCQYASAPISAVPNAARDRSDGVSAGHIWVSARIGGGPVPDDHELGPLNRAPARRAVTGRPPGGAAMNRPPVRIRRRDRYGNRCRATDRPVDARSRSSPAGVGARPARRCPQRRLASRPQVCRDAGYARVEHQRWAWLTLLFAVGSLYVALATASGPVLALGLVAAAAAVRMLDGGAGGRFTRMAAPTGPELPARTSGRPGLRRRGRLIPPAAGRMAQQRRAAT